MTPDKKNIDKLAADSKEPDVEIENPKEWIQILKDDPDVLEDFVEACRFEHELTEVLQQQALVRSAEEVLENDAPKPKKSVWFLHPTTIAAMFVFFIGLVWFWNSQFNSANLERVVAIGEIKRVHNAQAALGSDTDYTPGDSISSGKLTLVAGAVEIILKNGVRMVFEGPGELELVSPMLATLYSGQIVATVPENAHGFTIETPDAEVVDLGTEFAVKANPHVGGTEVQVYTGEVITRAKVGDSAQKILAGKAVRVGNELQELPYAPERFVRELPEDEGIGLEGFNEAFFNEGQVEGVKIHQPSNPIVVDGDLDEWSGGGFFRSKRDAKPDPQCFVEGAMRYDDQYLYIAARIDDPHAMSNVINPETDGELGWKGGGLQVRLSADRSLGWPVNANAKEYYSFRRIKEPEGQALQASNSKLVHLTLWYFAPDQLPCLHIAYGMGMADGVVNPKGFSGAFRRFQSGDGYILEYAIPWELLHAGNDPPKNGDTLAVSWQTHWSDASGRLWDCQHSEIRNPTEPQRILSFERAATWGKAWYE